ncbi:MAG TPA: hypothetical protein VK892_09510 [Pyrinomonadaceae bacterium]|nr:hypothetical protein [Pyrinomonadaceae bacterium]
MVYINIPYIPENNKIEKEFAKKEIQVLNISDGAKQSAFASIYNLNPRGVNFDGKNSAEASLLETALQKLGVPYRKSEQSEYYIVQENAG